MTVTIPTLETNRLILRAPEAVDYPDFKATFTSYRSRFMGGPLNAYEAWMLYAAEIGHWQVKGFGMWMIHDKATDETYGMAGGWQPAGWPEREIAWIIWPGAAGKGYALEASHAARAYYYGQQGWDGAVSYIDPKNLDSIRLAERLGAKKTPQPPPLTAMMRSIVTPLRRICRTARLQMRSKWKSTTTPTRSLNRKDGPLTDQTTDPVARAAEILKGHRESIDRLDAILVYTLGERFKHTQAVGKLKAEHDLPPSDPDARSAPDRTSRRLGICGRPRPGIRQGVFELHHR